MLSRRFPLHRFAVPLGIFVLLCLPALKVRAQGILYPPATVREQPFYVRDLHVNTTIHDAIAETTVEQTFVNSTNAMQEGTYLYPLPEGAAPTAFSMSIGDRTLEPQILTQDEARNVYESIVRQRRDPALLEYVGRNLLRVRVFPIPPQGERVIHLRYSEILKPENGLRKYAYPLSTSRFGNRPVGNATVTIRLQTTTPLKNLYSPTHDLSVRKSDDRNATATYEGLNDASDRDLNLYFSTGADDVGLSLLTYKSGDRDGYFMLLAAPRVVVPQERILPKQVVFVLDRTGSMAGPKIEQARKSLLYCLNSLHKNDRFDVITFNESPDTLTRTLVPASEANLEKARQFVQNIEASGGTNIDEALHAALTLLKNDEGQEKMVVFLTDGLPTVGETNIETILQHVREWSTPSPRLLTNATRNVMLSCSATAPVKPTTGEQPRLFCFGLGYDVNVPFLDRLGTQGHGETDYVKPEENVEAKVSAFFGKVTSPVLANLRLAVEGADVYDVYPKTIPDLFKGSQLVLTGRFRNNTGSGSVRLAGLTNGQETSFATTAAFGSAGGDKTYLPRLWAQRKIGWLIDQVRLAANPASQKEVIDEIVRLSREYGIITEYTSFLVNENEQRVLGLRTENASGGLALDEANANILRREIKQRAGRFGIQGQEATDQSLRAKDLQNYDKPLSRYQSANGSVAYAPNLQGAPGPAGPAGPQGVPSVLSSARGNFAGAGGFAGGGFPGGSAFNRLSQGKSSADVAAAYADMLAANTVTMQAVGERVFYRQKDGVWQDHTYDPKKQHLVKIQAFSEAHFALLRALPTLTQYANVGDEVLIHVGSNAVQIGKTGSTTLSSADLKLLSK